jgi:hypothetical protein
MKYHVEMMTAFDKYSNEIIGAGVIREFLLVLVVYTYHHPQNFPIFYLEIPATYLLLYF